MIGVSNKMIGSEEGVRAARDGCEGDVPEGPDR